MTGKTTTPLGTHYTCVVRAMGLKHASELIEKFVGGEVLRDAGKDPGYPSMYYFSVVCWASVVQYYVALCPPQRFSR